MAVFQSTLPYGSDLTLRYYGIYPHNISIHAPLRERPELLGVELGEKFISIHAPSRERH